MKIAILLPDIEKWSSFYGGACARVVQETIAQPFFKDDEVLVFCKSCHTKYAYKEPWSEPFFSRFWFGINKLFRKISISLDGWAWLIPQYRKLKKFDIIHIHNRPHYTLILRRLGYKGTIINHLQNDFNLSSEEFAKRVVDQSELIISCSQRISDRFFEKYPGESNKAHVINNGANTETFYYSSMENRKYQILFMGRNDPIKGIDNLLTAYEKLILKRPQLSLVLTGSSFFGDDNKLSDYEKKIRSRIEEINSKGGLINHVGYVEYEELPILLRESRIFCLPSIVHDAFPLVVIEAMLTGTPVVASNLGGIPEAIGEFGELAEPNADSLYDKLDGLLDDEERLNYYNLNCHKRAKEKYAWEIVSKEQHDIYKSFDKS